MKPSFALFIDIDRTLIADRHIIPKRNIDAIERARSAGHRVFINTGRSLGNIPQEILSQTAFDGVLSGNGTAITLDGKTIYQNFMPKDKLLALAQRIFETTEIWATFEGFRHSYAIPGRDRRLSDIEIPVKSFDEFEGYARHDDFQVTAVSIKAGKDFLNSIDNDFSHYTFDHYYDITSKGSNKANTMLKALDLLGIPRSNSIAFGDSENDLEMLLKAGTGVAVANAQPQLLEAADFVTLSNEDGGVGYAIEKILFKGE